MNDDLEESNRKFERYILVWGIAAVVMYLALVAMSLVLIK